MRLAISAALVCAFALVGCGTSYTCKDMCADANKCPGATQEDCNTSCADIDATNKAANCGATWDTFLTCVGDHKDLMCNESTSTGDACASEAMSYVGCLLGYCSTHSSDPVCQTY